MNKVYGKNNRLIVCFKGGHYESPNDTKVLVTERVPVIQGEAPDTVLVAGTETWSKKSSYVGAKKSKPAKRSKAVKKKTAKAKSLPTVTPGDNERVLQRIKDVAPNPSAGSLLEVCWQNWLRGCTHLSLFQGLNYKKAEDTKKVRQLGLELMKEFRQTVQ